MTFCCDMPAFGVLAQAEGAPATSGWAWLADAIAAPGVIEAALVTFGALVGLLVWWRLARLVRNARDRASLSDYLLGVEQALQGDRAGARKRLEKVLREDPENHYARLMLGKVLGELGEAEQAHQQHLYLQRAFAIESSENELLLAQSLLAAGLLEEAGVVAERLMARSPAQVDGRRFLYRVRLQQGDPSAAAAVGRRALGATKDGEARRALSQDLARTYADLGTAAWRAGDVSAAAAAAREAGQLDPTHGQLALLNARLDGARGDFGDVVRQLAAPADSRALVDAGDQVAAGAGCASVLPMESFAGLVEAGRWRCGACGAALARARMRCDRCGAESPPVLREPSLIAPIESATATMDGIDVNDAHVRRLVRSLESGEPVSNELVALGNAAVAELVRAGAAGASDLRGEIARILAEMDEDIVPSLLEEGERTASGRLFARGGGVDELVTDVLQQLGPAALPRLEPLLGAGHGRLQQVLIDYYLRLADVGAFQAILERYPPMDILHRLNQASPEVLARFLAAIPRGHFLVESMLLEPTFYRDEALLAAVPGADAPDVLVEVMLRRGPTRALVTALIAGVRRDETAEVSVRVLRELGSRVLEHCLAGFTDPEAADDAKDRLAEVLIEGGAAAVTHIVDGFGPASSAADDALRGLLRAIGDEAVDGLAVAYEKSGWLEKVSAGLVSRHNNRRVQIARALGEMRSRRSLKALKTLSRRERDDNLRLQLERALHAAGGER
ncbi:MAG: tetratricopeptide repeat protein [Planctomycetota bacterium]|nr:tetratricopeptide repeat protein [Planctomycetota bacterium]